MVRKNETGGLLVVSDCTKRTNQTGSNGRYRTRWWPTMARSEAARAANLLPAVLPGDSHDSLLWPYVPAYRSISPLRFGFLPSRSVSLESKEKKTLFQ